jgi:hypothetical protein
MVVTIAVSAVAQDWRIRGNAGNKLLLVKSSFDRGVGFMVAANNAIIYRQGE